MMHAPPKKKMPWWAVLLIIFGVFALIGLVVIGGIVWWVASNKDRIVADSKETVSQAQEYAATHDQNACVEEGLRKIEKCGGLMCEVNAQNFTLMCIQHAETTPGFCEGVPAPSEIMKTSSWVTDECRRRGKKGTDQRCTRMLQAVPQVCQHRAQP